MGTSRIIIGLALGGLILAGCKKEPEKANGTSAAPAAPSSPVSNPASTEPSITTTPQVAPTTVPVPPSDVPVPTTGGAADADAKALLTEVAVDVADKKWDAASAAFKKLNDMRPQLSRDTNDAVMKAEQKFVAAKTSSSLDPSGPGAPATQPGGELNK